MLGCNESNIISQQHLRKLGQLRRSNGRIFGQAMKKRPIAHYKKYSHFKGRDTAPTIIPAAGAMKNSCAHARDGSVNLARGLLPAGDAALCTTHLYRKVFILGYTQYIVLLRIRAGRTLKLYSYTHFFFFRIASEVVRCGLKHRLTECSLKTVSGYIDNSAR